ncbi:MAG TPA: YciI family protein [Gemmatimonadaceae bacterium]|nr:YciI family protein [Gemmatimonadaceae bacterium]
MKFLVIIYNDPALLDAMPQPEFDKTMRGCIEHADELKTEGRLIESQQLESPKTARTLRRRNNRLTITDGPFAETKEILAGFNLIEAEDIDEAVRIASEFPWSDVGSIEVRPIRDFEAVRTRVGAKMREAESGAREARPPHSGANGEVLQ